MTTLEQRLHSYEPIFGGWVLQGEIGTGSYARVYRVVNRDPFGMIVDSALKAIEIIPEGISNTEHLQALVREQYINEVNLMAAMRGISNVVSYEDHAVMEIRENGKLIGYDLLIRMELLKSLEEAIRGGDKNIRTDSGIKKMGMDLCRGLERCHRIGILHRDIKPKNIFINQFGDYKLGDFGVAHHLEGTMFARTRIGTELYAAPEITDRNSPKYGAKADIYSLGLVLYQLANDGCLPFITPETPRTKWKDAVQLRNEGEPIALPRCVGEDLGNVIVKACAFHPKDRYESAKEMYSAMRTLGRVKTLTETPTTEIEEKTEPQEGVLEKLWSQAGLCVIKTPSMKYMEDRIKSAPDEQEEDVPQKQMQEILTPEQAEKLPVWKPKIRGISNNKLVLDCYKEIGSWAFKSRKDLTAVCIKDAAVKIGEEAFSDCTGMTSLELLPPIEEIGAAAFRRCTRLEVVEFSEGIHKLGERVFQDCVSLKSVYIPDSISEISQQLFSGCRALEQIRIPAGVKSIGADAFRSCGSIQRFAIPDRVEKMGDGTFAGCKNMQEVKLPSQLVKIPASCFLGCTDLRTVIFSFGLQIIDAQAFRQCSALHEIELPYGLRKIGSEAFSQCEELTYITVPETVEAIGDKAFGESSNHFLRGRMGKLTVITPKGSYAWNYCRQNGIRVEEK